MPLARKTVSQLLELGENLNTNLTGNADFSDPAITAKLTALGTAGTQLGTAQGELVNLQTDVHTQEMEVQDKAAAYKELLNQLANLCEGKTKDPTKLSSGGFATRGQPESVGDMPKPSIVKATRGDNDGDIDVTTPAIRGARIYVCETAASPDGTFMRKYEGTKSTFTLSGAPAGSLCYLRVAAIGPNGTGPWSNVVGCRAA